MTDITKYRNVSLQHETYNTLIKISKVLLPDATLSISKTIEVLAKEKAKKLNGKVYNDVTKKEVSCPTWHFISDTEQYSVLGDDTKKIEHEKN